MGKWTISASSGGRIEIIFEKDLNPMEKLTRQSEIPDRSAPERSRGALGRSKLGSFKQQQGGQCVSGMLSTVNRA